MIFEVKKLSKKIGPQNLSLNFNLTSGDILVILGANGAGKTTSLKLLSGFLTKDSGDVLLNAKSIFSDIANYQMHMGYAGESLEFNKNLTVAQILKFASKLRGRDQKTPWRLEETLKNLHMQKVLHKKIGRLSKGYRQRLVLTVSLLHNPDILILDEATQGLDIMQKRQIYAVLQNNAKMISILATHDLAEAMQLASKIMIIDKFESIFYGTKLELVQMALEFNNRVEPEHLNALQRYLQILNNDRQKYAV